MNQPHGIGVSEDICFTLNCLDVHGVMVMGGTKPHAPISEETAPTLTMNMADTKYVPVVVTDGNIQEDKQTERS